MNVKVESICSYLELWQLNVEQQLGSKIIYSYQTSEFITLLIEAWNAAICFTCQEKDIALKATLMKQLKEAKKTLMKAHAEILAESVQALKARSISKQFSSLKITSVALEFVQRGWDNTLVGMIALVDGRLSMLEECI